MVNVSEGSHISLHSYSSPDLVGLVSVSVCSKWVCPKPEVGGPQPGTEPEVGVAEYGTGILTSCDCGVIYVDVYQMPGVIAVHSGGICPHPQVSMSAVGHY